MGPFWEPWGAFWGPGLEGGEPDFIRGVANAPAGIPHTFRIQFSGGFFISAYIPHTHVSISAFFRTVIHARDYQSLTFVIIIIVFCYLVAGAHAADPYFEIIYGSFSFV